MARRSVALVLAMVLVAAMGALDGSSSAATLTAPSSAPQEHAQPHGEPAAGEHSEGVLPIIARLFNFAVLAGALYYFLKSPIAAYLLSRNGQIRHDLVAAKEMRAAATTERAKIDAKLKALPAELDALRKLGEEDVAAERTRIARAAAAERERHLEHTRREIQMQLRIARRELVEHAAQLAVDVARSRIVGTITSEDQLRLVDRYATQLSEAR